MLEPRIQQQVFEAADALYQGADALTPAVAQAAQALATCLTSGNKLLLAAPGHRTWALGVCELLWYGLERERPPLAALALPAGAQDAIAPLRAMAQPGDLLLLAATPGHEADAQALVQAAHEQETAVVLVAAVGDAAGAPLGLADTDIWLPLPATRAARVREAHLLVAHLLCDAIDWHLLGESPGPEL